MKVFIFVFLLFLAFFTSNLSRAAAIPPNAELESAPPQVKDQVCVWMVNIVAGNTVISPYCKSNQEFCDMLNNYEKVCKSKLPEDCVRSRGSQATVTENTEILQYATFCANIDVQMNPEECLKSHHMSQTCQSQSNLPQAHARAE